MIYWRKRGLLLFVLLLAGKLWGEPPSADNSEAWKGLTKEQIQKIKSGEIVILDKDQSRGEEAKRFIQSAMIFNQPIDKVWALFRQTQNQERYLPRLYESSLVEDHSNWNLNDFFVKFAFVNIRYRVRHNFEPENYYFYWALDPSYKNDLKHLEGYWRLYKLDENHTLARYGTIVIISELIPKSLMEEMTRKDLPESLQAVKKYIDSGGSYTKPDYKKK